MSSSLFFFFGLKHVPWKSWEITRFFVFCFNTICCEYRQYNILATTTKTKKNNKLFLNYRQIPYTSCRKDLRRKLGVTRSFIIITKGGHWRDTTGAENGGEDKIYKTLSEQASMIIFTRLLKDTKTQRFPSRNNFSVPFKHVQSTHIFSWPGDNLAAFENEKISSFWHQKESLLLANPAFAGRRDKDTRN